MVAVFFAGAHAAHFDLEAVDRARDFVFEEVEGVDVKVDDLSGFFAGEVAVALFFC